MKKPQLQQDVQAGLFLIADPFLVDPDFSRSIIFLVSHDETGSVGFIINQPCAINVGHVVDGFPEEKRLLCGGPVGQDQVFFIHTCASISGAYPISNELFWAGDPDALRNAVDQGILPLHEVLFFNGYSGWGPGQLQSEIADKSWVLAEMDIQELFKQEDQLWKKSLRALGAPYAWMSEAPEHPQLN